MITFHFHLQPQYKYELFHIKKLHNLNTNKKQSLFSVLIKIKQMLSCHDFSYVFMPNKVTAHCGSIDAIDAIDAIDPTASIDNLIQQKGT